MNVGRTVHRLMAPLTLAVFLATSLAHAQGWEDSDVGAPPDVGTTEPEDAAPAPQPAPAPDPNQYSDQDPSALTEFRSTLDPHGIWVNDPTYGVVWVPNPNEVGKDFAPYVTSGHWALTGGGDWIWVSDYPFGWVVFHYGRWVWIGGTGWAWIPGRQYANAWVVWRVPTAEYAYVGWAPMPPSYVWVGGAAVTLWFTPPAPYVFCDSHYVFHHHIHHYIVHDRYRVRYIAQRTRVYRPAVPNRRAAAPSVSEARIPPRSLPRNRVAADPRAVAAARRQTSGPAQFSGQRLRAPRTLGTTAPHSVGSTHTVVPGARSSFSAAPAPGVPVGAAPHRPAAVGARPAPGTQAARPVPMRPAPGTWTAPSAPARPTPVPAPGGAVRRAAPATVERAAPSAPARSWTAPQSSWTAPQAAPRSSWSPSAPRSSWSSAPRSWSAPSAPARSFGGGAPSRGGSSLGRRR